MKGFLIGVIIGILANILISVWHIEHSLSSIDNTLQEMEYHQ